MIEAALRKRVQAACGARTVERRAALLATLRGAPVLRNAGSPLEGAIRARGRKRLARSDYARGGVRCRTACRVIGIGTRPRPPGGRAFASCAEVGQRGGLTPFGSPGAVCVRRLRASLDDRRSADQHDLGQSAARGCSHRAADPHGEGRSSGAVGVPQLCRSGALDPAFPGGCIQHEAPALGAGLPPAE